MHVLRALHEARDRLVAALERLAIAQRVVQPVPQQPTAHAGGAVVEQREERRRGLTPKRLRQLEVAPRRGVEPDIFPGTLGRDRADVRQRLALRLAGIVEERAAGADRKREILDAKAGEGAR